jgi:hypothetical protein
MGEAERKTPGLDFGTHTQVSRHDKPAAKADQREPLGSRGHAFHAPNAVHAEHDWQRRDARSVG